MSPYAINGESCAPVGVLVHAPQFLQKEEEQALICRVGRGRMDREFRDM